MAASAAPVDSVTGGLKEAATTAMYLRGGGLAGYPLAFSASACNCQSAWDPLRMGVVTQMSPPIHYFGLTDMQPPGAENRCYYSLRNRNTSRRKAYKETELD